MRGGRRNVATACIARDGVEGRRGEALQAFRRAVEDCRITEFEHHAAKAWLKQLGG